MTAIRPDGEIVCWNTEGEYPGTRPVEDRYHWLSALVDATRRDYPELRPLLPERPDGARDCRHPRHPIFAEGKVSCPWCCGLGWVKARGSSWSDGMTWEPITESELAFLIEDAEARMEPPMLALWEGIRIRPAKWDLPPWGNEGGGFWVVGVIGQTCVWYNDIEDGFNISRYESSGRISDYWCNQDDLNHCLWSLG